MSAQRLRRWSNIVQMVYQCFVLTGMVEDFFFNDIVWGYRTCKNVSWQFPPVLFRLELYGSNYVADEWAQSLIPKQPPPGLLAHTYVIQVYQLISSRWGSEFPTGYKYDNSYWRTTAIIDQIHDVSYHKASQHLRRWSNIVQMLYETFTGMVEAFFLMTLFEVIALVRMWVDNQVRIIRVKLCGGGTCWWDPMAKPNKQDTLK